MPARALFAAVALAALFAQPAGASLDRYFIRGYIIADFSAQSPKTIVLASEPGGYSNSADPSALPTPTFNDIAIVDRSGPTLRKLVYRDSLGFGITTMVSTFNGFIWYGAGVGYSDFRGAPFTATAGSINSSTNVGSATWPVLTGYFTTGYTFCNSNPSFICSLAVASHLQTVDPDLRSTFYDIGPWEFHGTGFIGPTPFVFFTSTLPGNSQIGITGEIYPNATVPALPLLGVAALGASLFAMAVAALKRRGE